MESEDLCNRAHILALVLREAFLLVASKAAGFCSQNWIISAAPNGAGRDRCGLPGRQAERQSLESIAAPLSGRLQAEAVPG